MEFIRHPKFDFIEARSGDYERPTFKKHTHDTYSIGIILTGRSNFFYQNRMNAIHKGEIALINPGEVHACNPQLNSVMVYRMFFVDIKFIHKLARQLSEKNSCIPDFTDSVVQNQKFYDLLYNSYNLLKEKPDDTLTNDVLIYQSFFRLLKNHSTYDKNSTTIPDRKHPLIKHAYDYIMDHRYQNISLSRLASVANMSEYHLLRVFRNTYGLPPHTFQIQQRINDAKKMLTGGNSIVDVALITGFSDQSHFTRKFKEYVGVTPNQYKSYYRK